ncbi:hypothetical protein H4R26_005057, partial [Coemansia thaxteri]
MFTRNQEDAGKAQSASDSLGHISAATTAKASQGTGQPSLPATQQQQFQHQQQQLGTNANEEKRYTNIAPRPSMIAQQPAAAFLAKKKTISVAKAQRKSKKSTAAAATAAAAAAPADGKMKARTVKRPKQAANTAFSSTLGNALVGSSASLTAAPHTESATDGVEANVFTLDGDDKLIQELLAGIPSSAWLPTDPLTSDDWFLDPGSSVITHDSIFQLPGPPSLAPRHSDNPTLSTPRAVSAAGQSNATAMPENNKFLEATAGAAGLQTTSDTRVLAGVRPKRDTPLLSGRPARGNPLSGFAKKHGVGYAVGNQVAILSPALLSSSPPSARQIRENPYKYYSPPKPTHRAQLKTAQLKGRNLMLAGSSTSTTTKPTASSPL